jgi:hypothetical protein
MPARSLNLLAAAWIQFQTHDWFSHGEVRRDKPFKLKLQPDDPLVRAGGPETMEIPRTASDPNPDPDGARPPTYVSTVSLVGRVGDLWKPAGDHRQPAAGKPVGQGTALPDGKLFLLDERSCGSPN